MSTHTDASSAELKLAWKFCNVVHVFQRRNWKLEFVFVFVFNFCIGLPNARLLRRLQMSLIRFPQQPSLRCHIRHLSTWMISECRSDGKWTVISLKGGESENCHGLSKLYHVRLLLATFVLFYFILFFSKDMITYQQRMNVSPYMSCHFFFTTPNDIQFKCIIEGLLTLINSFFRQNLWVTNQCFNEEDIIKLKTF